MTLGCEEVRLVAPDTALDLLDGAARADVLTHVADCARCRAEIVELSGAADALLVLVPGAEPPTGFEAAVLGRIAAERPIDLHSRRRWLGPLVGAAAVVLGLLVGRALVGDHAPRTGLVAARLLTADGRPAGQVVVADGEMTCVLDRAPKGFRYVVQVHTDDTVANVGTFVSRGPGWSWTTPLPVHGDQVRHVVILDDHGTVRARADL